LFFAFALAACGGSESTVYDSSQTTPGADLTGTWTGTWLSSRNVGGGTTSTFTQSGSTVEGDISFTGSPCFSGGIFQGTLRGRDLSGTVSAGTIRVSMTATISATSMNGTYNALEAGACSGDTGTFSSKR
jgi:hypothetical protein